MITSNITSGLKILLVYPRFDEIYFEESEKIIPFGLLSLGAVLKKNQLNVVIFDQRIELPDYNYLHLIEEYDVFAFSVMTAQIKYAYAFAKKIKAKDTQKFVIWGGIHPTLFPEQVARDKSIDFVLTGEAEGSFLRLINELNRTKGLKDLKNIKGLHYILNGELVSNKEFNLIDPKEFPSNSEMLELIDVEKYVKRIGFEGKRVIDVITSRGCPYRCTFCVNPYLNSKSWRCVDARGVVNDIESIVSEYNISYIRICDDYFFPKLDRVQDIFNMLEEKGIFFEWEANIRADFFRKDKNKEIMKTFYSQGCTSLNIGMESGSERILKLFKKDINISDIINASRILVEIGILVNGFWIMGVPTETKDEIKATLQLIYFVNTLGREINKRNWIPGVYRPYPGGELYEFVKKDFPQYQEPSSLSEWLEMVLDGSGYISSTGLPWLDSKKKELISNIILSGSIIRNYFKSKQISKIVLFVFYSLVLLRYRFKFWSLPLDLYFYKWIVQLRKRID